MADLNDEDVDMFLNFDEENESYISSDSTKKRCLEEGDDTSSSSSYL